MIQEIIHHDIHQNGDPRPCKSLFNFPFEKRNGVGHGSVKLTLKYKQGDLLGVGVGLARDDYNQMAWFFESEWRKWSLQEIKKTNPESGSDPRFVCVSICWLFYMAYFL